MTLFCVLFLMYILLLEQYFLSRDDNDSDDSDRSTGRDKKRLV